MMPGTRRRTRRQRLLRDRYGGSFLPLVAALAVLFLAGPSLAGEGNIGQVLIALLTYTVLALGVVGATDSREEVGVVGAIGALAVVAQLVGDIADVAPLLVTGRALIMLMLLIVQVLILRDILPEPRVTTSTVLGAVGTYLLLVITWASVYAILGHADDDAFAGAIEPDAGALEFLYFSTITQTTVGYGDILPASDLARSLAGFEALSGQLYVAILVAWLVGRAISQAGE
jgi:hypothetical protein